MENFKFQLLLTAGRHNMKNNTREMDSNGGLSKYGNIVSSFFNTLHRTLMTTTKPSLIFCISFS